MISSPFREGRLKNLVALNRGRRAAYGDWARRLTPRTVATDRVDAPGTPRHHENGRLGSPRMASRAIPAAEDAPLPAAPGHTRRGEPRRRHGRRYDRCGRGGA